MLVRIGALTGSTRETGEGAGGNTGGAVEVVQLAGNRGGLRIAGAVGFLKLAGT